MAYMQTESNFIIKTNNPEYYPNDKRLSEKEGKRLHKEHAIKRLLKMLKPGDTIYTVLRHVSSSGMSRRIDLYVMRDNEPQYLSGYAATAMSDKVHDKGGIIVSGCGMDMGFHLVYNLGATLWPNGTPKPHRSRNGSPDNSGGYALNHKWL